MKAELQRRAAHFAAKSSTSGPEQCPCAVWVSGLIQTALYLDFFYYYILAWKNNKKLSLPS